MTSALREQVPEYCGQFQQVGQVNETVEVASVAPMLESQSSSLGSVINERFVNELPLNGRNFVQLAILSPGVNGVGFSVTGTVMSGTRPDDRRPGSEIFRTNLSK